MSRFVQEVGRVIGRRARLLPRAVDRGVCVAIDRGFRAFTGTQMAPSLIRPAYYPHEKAARAFGYRPRYSLAQGMAEIARRYPAC